MSPSLPCCVESQQLCQRLPHLGAGHHLVHKAVLVLELAALEPGRQFFANGLFNDPGTGKADEGPGFRQHNIPREAKLAVTPPVVG